MLHCLRETNSLHFYKKNDFPWHVHGNHYSSTLKCANYAQTAMQNFLPNSDAGLLVVHLKNTGKSRKIWKMGTAIREGALHIWGGDLHLSWFGFALVYICPGSIFGEGLSQTWRQRNPRQKFGGPNHTQWVSDLAAEQPPFTHKITVGAKKSPLVFSENGKP